MEADHGRRGVGGDRQGVEADRVQGEQIAVRMIALGRAWPAIARRAEAAGALRRFIAG